MCASVSGRTGCTSTWTDGQPAERNQWHSIRLHFNLPSFRASIYDGLFVRAQTSVSQIDFKWTATDSKVAETVRAFAKITIQPHKNPGHCGANAERVWKNRRNYRMEINERFTIRFMELRICFGSGGIEAWGTSTKSPSAVVVWNICICLSLSASPSLAFFRNKLAFLIAAGSGPFFVPSISNYNRPSNQKGNFSPPLFRRTYQMDDRCRRSIDRFFVFEVTNSSPIEIVHSLADTVQLWISSGNCLLRWIFTTAERAL